MEDYGMEAPNILWFREIRIKDIPSVGGKGASLGEMANHNFPIPPGFAVTAQAYFRHLDKTGIKEKIVKTIDSIDVENTKQLASESEKVRNLILKTPMPTELANDIVRAYGKLGERKIAWLTSSEEEYVAVRSSATAEDLPEASFAGQQETFLNVKGRQALIEAVRKCWASLFTARAVYYRKKNNFSTEQVGISVIVQKMVNGQTSGIMFTAEPTGDETKIVIEAGFGLGEAIVSGSVTPDTYTVDKGSFKILEKKIHEQDFKIVKKGKENVREKLGSATARKQKIDDKTIVQLAKLGKQIERHYKKPQDIEWAIEDKELFIVQSRPITTLGLKGKGSSREEREKQLAKIKGMEILKGLAASPGIASGKVKVVRNVAQISKVGKGDILVAPMTSPDWVPTMKKSRAIVTDEGGVTCFTGDTNVLTNKGLLSFEDLLKKTSESETVFALSINKKTLQPEWKKINAIMKRKGKTISVNVSQKGIGTNRLKLTPNHKMMAIEKRQVVEKEMSKILEEQIALCSIDWVPSLNDASQNSRRMSYLMGAMFTDGSIQLNKRRGKVTFVQKETREKKEFINTVLQYFKELFRTQLTTRPRTYASTIRGYTFTSTVNAYYCTRKEPAQALLEEYDALEEWAMRTDEENLQSFLGGVIDGDGSYSKRDSGRIHIYSGDDKLVKAIIIACLRLGIQPTIIKNRDNCKNIQITEGFEKLLKYSKRIKIDRKKKALGTKLLAARQVLGDIIDEVNWKGKIKPYVEGNLLIDSKKITKRIIPLAKGDAKRELQKICSSPIRMKRARKETELGTREVFNIEVEDNHNYVVFTENFTPIWVANCHAAIVSRELGIPCVVGTESATETLEDNDEITVNGYDGLVYKGIVEVEKPAEEKIQVIKVTDVDKIESVLEEGIEKGKRKEKETGMEEPAEEEEQQRAEEELEEVVEKAKEEAQEIVEDYSKVKAEEMPKEELAIEEGKIVDLLKKIAPKVKVNVALPDAAQPAADTKADGVGLLRAEHMITSTGKHPAEFIRQGKEEELKDVVKEGIRKVAALFPGKPVWYRTFDARTDEFRELEGGENEPKEDNPMLGWHGIRRDLDQPKMLKAQFKAVKELHDEGLGNVGVMLAFVQSSEEVRKAKAIAEEAGMQPGKRVQFGVMVETPAAVWSIDEIIKEGIDFISFGTNDLTQLTLGIDRNNENIQKLFTELHPAVLRSLRHVIRKCRKAKVTTSICGQAASNPEMAKHLVRFGIDSVSANIDAVEKIRQTVLLEEKKLLLEKKR